MQNNHKITGYCLRCKKNREMIKLQHHGCYMGQEDRIDQEDRMNVTGKCYVCGSRMMQIVPTHIVQTLGIPKMELIAITSHASTKCADKK